MNKKLLNKLHEQAKKIAWVAAKNFESSKNDWHNYQYNQDMDYEILGPLSVKFKNPQNPEYAHLTLHGVVGAKLRGLVVHEPRVLKKETKDSSVHVINNTGTKDVTRTYSVDIEHTSTKEKNESHSLLVGLSQEIKVGGEASQFASTTKVNFETNNVWGKTETNANRENRHTETEVICPPGKRLTLTTVRSSADMEQKTEAHCELDYAIDIWSHKDYSVRLKSTSHAREYFEGLGDKSVEWSAWFKANPVDDGALDWAFEPTEYFYEHTERYSNTTSGDIKITEEEI